VASPVGTAEQLPRLDFFENTFMTEDTKFVVKMCKPVLILLAFIIGFILSAYLFTK